MHLQRMMAGLVAAAILTSPVRLTLAQNAEGYAASVKRRQTRGRKTMKAGNLLPAGRWNPETRAALEDFIRKQGRNSPGYDENRPPTAILMLEDAAVIGNPGEQAFRRLVNRGEFKFGEEFWSFIPPSYQRRARVGYNEFKDQPSVIWPKDPYYQMFRKAMFRAYQESCHNYGPKACAEWLTKILTGFDEGDVADYMEQTVVDGLKEPVGYETIVDAPDDDLPIQVRTGLRIIPEMGALCKVLLREGFDVWIFSSSNFWIGEALAVRYGIDKSHVVGIHSKVVNGVLQSVLVEPIPVGSGEAVAATMVIGHGPELAIGGEKDTALFEYGPGLRLAIDLGNERFRAMALTRGWLVQRMFKPQSESGKK